ncbi:MAG: hypothetical protein IRZ10_09390 [Thermoflavifilum sp.]|nr:hypothetical protein [Thermoflavifilum sp.]MCL6514622.1 hypothetical protein [Alicyclobacillus sp.]
MTRDPVPYTWGDEVWPSEWAPPIFLSVPGAGVWTDWWWREGTSSLQLMGETYPVLMPWYPWASPALGWWDAWNLSPWTGVWV